MTSWLCRPAAPADLPVLNEIFAAASLGNEGDRPHLLAHPEVLVLDGAAVREGRTWVAVAPAGAIGGFASWSTGAEPGVLEVEDLFVEPARQRQGAARILIAQLVAVAGELGGNRLEVVGNPHALAFYRAVGFIPDGERETLFGPAPHLSLPL